MFRGCLLMALLTRSLLPVTGRVDSLPSSSCVDADIWDSGLCD